MAFLKERNWDEILEVEKDAMEQLIKKEYDIEKNDSFCVGKLGLSLYYLVNFETPENQKLISDAKQIRFLCA